MVVKRPPIPIIINLLLLTAGYLYYTYPYIEKTIEDRHCGAYASSYIIPLLFFTFGITAIYVAVFKRHAKSILFFGTLLFLIGIFTCIDLFSHKLSEVITVCLFLITGILFIIWSIILFEDINNPEDNSILIRRKYKYWLYSAIILCVVGLLFGILGNHFYYKNYDPLSENMYISMGCLLIVSILQLIIYYILCKIRAYREKKINCQKNDRK